MGLDQGHGEPGMARGAGQRLADVPGADGYQVGGEDEWLDVNLHLAPAAKPVLLGEGEGEGSGNPLG